MILIQSYGAINQDVQQFGLRMWSWSGDAGAAAALTYGPGHLAEAFVYHPGLREAAVFHPGLKEVEVHW